MEVRPLGPKHSTERHESDIFVVTDSSEGLTVLIDTVDSFGSRRELKVYFEYARGYRYLDEGDLLMYWKSDKFITPYHVYELLSGGWSNGERTDPGLLHVSQAVGVKEWFIATTNGCLNVLTDSVPTAEFVDA